MSNVIKVKLLSERTSGVPPVIFVIGHFSEVLMVVTGHAAALLMYQQTFVLWQMRGDVAGHQG